MGQARSQAVAGSEAGGRSVVLDSGALIAFERGNARMRALLREAGDAGARLIVPAGVVAQVWRKPAKQVAIGALLKANATVIVPLDQVLAEAVGILCAKRNTSDVVDASVVVTARRERASIITSDIDDLRHLDKGVTLHRI